MLLTGFNGSGLTRCRAIKHAELEHSNGRRANVRRLDSEHLKKETEH